MLPLPAAPTSELPVDAGRLVHLRTDYVESKSELHRDHVARTFDPDACFGGVIVDPHVDDSRGECFYNVAATAVHANGAALGREVTGEHLDESLRHPFVEVAVQQDVGASTGHVGGHGDRAKRSGLADDSRLIAVSHGVQPVVLNLRVAEEPADLVRLLDRPGADQHRTANSVPVRDFPGYGL